MNRTQDLKNLQACRQELLSRNTNATTQSEGGLSARERLALLLDDGSFVEYSQLTAPESMMTEAVVTGSGTIDSRPVFVFAQDYSVLSGSMSAVHARKIARVMDMAQKTGSPLIGIYDSTGARLEEGAGALDAYGTLLARQAELSGVIPQIALVLGPCAGTAAFLPTLSDILVMGGSGALYMAGPQVVAARTDGAKAGDIGGGEAMVADGAAHLYYADEKEAIGAVRSIMAYLPSNNIEDAPFLQGEELNRLLDFSDEPSAAEILEKISDAGSYFCLQTGYADAATVAWTRLGGQSAGVVIAQGILNEAACDKISRFVRLCDAFNLPVVTFVEAQGFAVERHHAALMRAGARLVYAYAEATVPKLSVVTGDAYGGAYLSLGSHAMGADVTYAWPSAVISAMDPEAAAQIVYAKELGQAENPIAARADYAQKYVTEYGCALVAEHKGLVDEVIDPKDTRRMLIAGLYLFASKQDVRPARKHGNAPL